MKYSSNEAKYRIQMKRYLRLRGYSSIGINDLCTEQLEEWYTKEKQNEDN